MMVFDAKPFRAPSSLHPFKHPVMLISHSDAFVYIAGSHVGVIYIEADTGDVGFFADKQFYEGVHHPEDARFTVFGKHIHRFVSTIPCYYASRSTRV